MVAAAAERDALVAAPTGQQHAHILRRRRTLHGAFVEVMAVVPGYIAAQGRQDAGGGGRAVVDLQALLGRDRIDQAVFVAGRGLLVLLRRLGQPGERGRGRSARSPQRPGGEHRNAGGVEPAAQMHAHGVGTARAVRHRRGAKRKTGFGGFAVVNEAKRGHPLRLPPAPHAPAAGFRREQVARRQAPHRAVERAFAEWPEVGMGKPCGGRVLVEVRRHAGGREHRVHVAGEHDAVCGGGIVERPGADVVPNKKQPAALGVPRGESVIAVQVLRALRAPPAPSLQNQRRVRQRAVVFAGNAQRGAQVVAPVNAGAGDHPIALASRAAGRAVRRLGPAPAEASGFRRPHRGGVCPAPRQGGQHGIERRCVEIPAQRLDSADHVHHSDYRPHVSGAGAPLWIFQLDAEAKFQGGSSWSRDRG